MSHGSNIWSSYTQAGNPIWIPGSQCWPGPIYRFSGMNQWLRDIVLPMFHKNKWFLFYREVPQKVKLWKSHGAQLLTSINIWCPKEAWWEFNLHVSKILHHLKSNFFSLLMTFLKFKHDKEDGRYTWLSFAGDDFHSICESCSLIWRGALHMFSNTHTVTSDIFLPHKWCFIPTLKPTELP